MVWIIVLLCIILSVFLILTLRLGLRIRYSEEKGLTVVLTAAGVPLRLIYPETRKTVKIRLRDFTPRAVKKRREKSNKEKFKSRKISRKQNGKNEKRKQTFSDKLEMLRQIIRIVRLLLRRFLTYLRTDIRCFEITVSGMDAAETAIVYGAVSQSAAYLFELLDNNTNVRWKNADKCGIYIDFVGDHCEAAVDITLSLRVWQLLDLLWRGISSLSFAAEKRIG